MTIQLKAHQSIYVTGNNDIVGTTGDTIHAYGQWTSDTLSGSGMTFIANDSTGSSVVFAATNNHNTFVAGKNPDYVDFRTGTNDTVIVGKGDSVNIWGSGNIGAVYVAAGATKVSLNGDTHGNVYVHDIVGMDFQIKGVTQQQLNADVASASHLVWGASTNHYVFNVGDTKFDLQNYAFTHSTFHAV